MTRLLTVFFWLASLTVAPAAAADVDYSREIKPLLKERCFACHGALKQEASLRLDAGSLILQGGASGPALAPNEPSTSLLLDRIADTDPASRMPPEGAPLTPEQIGRLRMWIEQGARVPQDEQPEPDPREHWAFRRPTRPRIPEVRNPGWVRNPIDNFLAVAHEKNGLTPLPPAKKAQLLRRVSLDLIGLPPTRAELRAFLADDSEGVYQRMVDRLLNNPHYGERWGRHWMDVWRYSDWYGRRAVPDVLNSYGQIWRWRDWIVRSLNEDKGYDRMVMEMLAADEIAPTDDESLVATGFLVRNFYRWNYNSWMKDNVEHTGKAFLGLTFNCCQCHDHKFDPISQEDYFRFRAFFEPLELRHDRVPGEPDPGPFPKYSYGAAYSPITSGMIRVFDEKLDATTYMYAGGEARNIIAGKPPIPPGVPTLLSGEHLRVEPIDLPATAWYPGLEGFVQQEEIGKRDSALQTARSELAQAREHLDQTLPGLLAAVQQAETDIEAARGEGLPSRSGPDALVGTQSLVMDASKGRRVLGHRVADVKLADGASVSYRIKILRDAHTNFQLGLDLSSGATGGYVAFDAGRIQSYRPGTFETFEVGRYDFAAGQNVFDVRLVVNFTSNTAVLTVACLAHSKKLVDAVPVALNGWHSPPNEKQGVLLDARTGSVVVYDHIVLSQSDAEPQVCLDFEPPTYQDETDVIAVPGWIEPPFSTAPATSRVSRLVTQSAAIALAEQVRQTAPRKVDAARLAVSVAEAKVTAAEADLASVRARIEADQAQFVDRAVNADEMSQKAARAERLAGVAASRLNLALTQQEVAAARLLPTGDEKQAAALQQAEAKSAAAQSALAMAEAASQTESKDYTPLSPKYPQKSTGRRAALARWIANKDNPLTARVAVNHMWLRHFGRGLVTTPADFGRNGAAPSHPELLDWLAVELIEHDWSMKHIHRLIVTSAAYQMASASAEIVDLNPAVDVDNVFLSRFIPQRLSAEVIRDSLLHVSGTLDTSIGGPEIDQSLAMTPRRSLYFSHHGEKRMAFLDLFDAATPAECYERSSSIRPQQALAMSNGPLTAQQGRLLAKPLWQAVGDDGDETNGRKRLFIEAAFEQVLGRGPTAMEVEAAGTFLNDQSKYFADLPSDQLSISTGEAIPPSAEPAARARENFVQALFNHNDFVTVR